MLRLIAKKKMPPESNWPLENGGKEKVENFLALALSPDSRAANDQPD